MIGGAARLFELYKANNNEISNILSINEMLNTVDLIKAKDIKLLILIYIDPNLTSVKCSLI